MSWHDKVVIVTGGGSGMGRDVCLALGRAGARVVLGNRSASAAQAVADAIVAAGGAGAFSRYRRFPRRGLRGFGAIGHGSLWPAGCGVQ